MCTYNMKIGAEKSYDIITFLFSDALVNLFAIYYQTIFVKYEQDSYYSIQDHILAAYKIIKLLDQMLNQTCLIIYCESGKMQNQWKQVEERTLIKF